MYLVIPGANEASRAKQYAATTQFQFLTDHVRFITHERKRILLLDVSNCSAAEVEKILRAVPGSVTARPRGSVLILSDFMGASIDREAIRVMKEDKGYIKKSAGTAFPIVVEISAFTHWTVGPRGMTA